MDYSEFQSNTPYVCVRDGSPVPYTSVEYSCDSRGNLLSKTYSDGTSIAYDYNDTTWKDRLTSYNGTAISYDTIGNPENWHNGATMLWQRGRQLASYTNNGTTTSFTYNDEGIRRSKTTNGIRTEYDVYDGTLRRMSDGTNTLQFVYGNGLSSVIFNGTEYWYVFNAQGDVIGLIDATGAYVVEYTYDSWGKPLSKTGSLADTLGTLNPFRYRGYIYDEETGLYYCQSRYYDPEADRWLNADEYASTGVGPLGHNMFAYCNNNPISLCDSTGCCPRYYDEFTCPFCNHWKIENGIYPDVETNNPYRAQVNGNTYQKVSETTYEQSTNETEASEWETEIYRNNSISDAIGMTINTIPIAIVAPVVIPATLTYVAPAVAASIEAYPLLFGGISAMLSLGAELYGICANPSDISIGYMYPYYKCVEVYENVNSPGSFISAVTVYSSNQVSYFHSERHFEAYYPGITEKLYY